MNSISSMDALLQAQFPTLMVPVIGSVEAMEKNGHRFLMANNGVWVQVKRSWLNAALPITSQPKVAVPYGAVNMECKTTPFPKKLFQEFGAFAKEQYPMECAARIIFQRDTQLFRLEKMAPTKLGTAHVQYNIPVLSENEELVVDIHSHATFDSFFSATDDQDDASEVKVAGVIGFPNGVDQTPTWCFRLCVNGLFEKINAVQIDENIVFKLEN